ncbi:MAG TPA: amidase family protein, partial [Tissierellaceae bacterium]|nr:amidase family protein [Tissierellaceae bacterium]
DLDQLFVRSRSEAFGKEVKKRILLGTYLLSEEAREKYYKKAQKIRTLLINDFNQVFSQYDLILTPTSPRLARPVEGSKDTYKNYIEAVNLAGLCAISVPTSNDGIEPVGLQIIGDRFNEEKIIKAALAYEGMVE